MGAIRDNSWITDQLELIAKQHQTWLLYAIFTPILFGFTGLIVYLAEMTDATFLFWVYILIISVTALCWWLWTMYVIKRMYFTQTVIAEMVIEISEDLREIKTSIIPAIKLTDNK